MPKQKHVKMIKYYVPLLESLRDSPHRAEYLADLMGEEGLDPVAAVLLAYCKTHEDGLRVFALFLQRNLELFGEIDDLLPALCDYLR